MAERQSGEFWAFTPWVKTTNTIRVSNEFLIAGRQALKYITERGPF
jgi:hypothetical protein